MTRPWEVRARVLAIIRARILTGVADYNEYDLTYDEDRLVAEAETDTIMAALFRKRT